MAHLHREVGIICSFSGKKPVSMFQYPNLILERDSAADIKHFSQNIGIPKSSRRVKKFRSRELVSHLNTISERTHFFCKFLKRFFIYV